MGNVNPITPSISGGNGTPGGNALTAGTHYIVPTTAQSALDFKKLVIRFEATTSTANSIIPIAGDNFTDVNISNGSTITIGTSTSATGVVVLGGTFFESSRFKDSDGYFGFQIVSSHTVFVEAYLLP